MEFSIQKQNADFSSNIKGKVERTPFGILGPTRSGKTSLLEILAGLSEADQGFIKLNQTPIFSSVEKINVPAEKRRIVLVSSAPVLFPHLNVRKNILFGLKKSPEKSFSSQVIDLFNLYHLKNLSGRGLSFWEKMRVALARAVIRRPEVLLVDEPQNEDPLARHQFMEWLRRIDQYLKIPVIYASRSPSETAYLTDQIMVLEHGQVLASGATSEVFQGEAVWAAGGAETFENIYELPLLELNRREGHLQLDFSGQPIVVGYPNGDLKPKYKIKMRADQMDIRTSPHGLSSDDQCLKADIEKIIPCADHTIVCLNLTGQKIFVKIRPDPSFVNHHPVYLIFNRQSILVIE